MASSTSRLQHSFKVNEHERLYCPSLFAFMRDLIAQLAQIHHYRTSETYTATLRSFASYRGGCDLGFHEIDSQIITCYETYLHNRGVTKNTSSFYMRILRAVYNRAVDKEYTIQRNPFKHVYTGVDKTAKRAIPISTIKMIKDINLAYNASLDFARDMFLFSFYTRGMSFIDMAYLAKNNLNYGTLRYRRHKTGQQLSIRWEPCMQTIVDKYNICINSNYLLPIITDPDNGRSQYKNALSRINKNLKRVARLMNISTPLSLYVARHSWASIARQKNIPISVISEGMGHDSELTTRIYLASLESSVVDDANADILNDL